MMFRPALRTAVMSAWDFASSARHQGSRCRDREQLLEAIVDANREPARRRPNSTAAGVGRAFDVAVDRRAGRWGLPGEVEHVRSTSSTAEGSSSTMKRVTAIAS